MPNWCYQSLEIRGPSKDLDSFRESLLSKDYNDKGEQEGNLDLNSLCPLDEKAYAYRTMQRDDGTDYMMKVFATMSEDGFDGYSHAVSVWGTKWGACHIQLNSDTMNPYPLNLYYESAWSPASGLIQAISSKYPTLVFGLLFTEEADFFAGIQVFQNNEIIAEKEYPTEDSDELREKRIALESKKEEILDSEWDDFYEICGRERIAREDKMCSDLTKILNKHGKSYSPQPRKKVK